MSDATSLLIAWIKEQGSNAEWDSNANKWVFEKIKKVRKKTQGPEDLIDEIFEFWKATMGKKRAVFDSKRYNAISKARKLGYNNDQLKAAIKGCSLTPFNMGDNVSSQKHNDITLILRDADHIERFIAHAEAPPKKVVRLLKLPTEDSMLESFAIKHKLPRPTNERTYYEYKQKLISYIEINNITSG